MALDNLREVSVDEARMLSPELHLATEAQVVADEDRCTCHVPSGKALVVAVPQTQDESVIVAGHARAPDFHQAKVPQSIVTRG